MILYHATYKENLDSILSNGLTPNRMGIVYLTPERNCMYFFGAGYNVVLEVETGFNKLTAFEDCKEWEVLCWGKISPENIRVIKKKRGMIGDIIIVTCKKCSMEYEERFYPRKEYKCPKCNLGV